MGLKYVKVIVLGLAVSILSGCGGGSSSAKTTTETSVRQNSAIEKIANYAQHGLNIPTVTDYTQAGILGVNAENITEVNAMISEHSYTELDTKEELQNVVHTFLNDSDKTLVDENVTEENVTISVDNNSSDDIPDTTPPVITILGDSTVSIVEGSKYTDAGVTATDDRDGNITANIVTTSNVDTSTVGTYSVTYNVNDTAGNSATVATRTVKVLEKLTQPMQIETLAEPICSQYYWNKPREKEGIDCPSLTDKSMYHFLTIRADNNSTPTSWGKLVFDREYKINEVTIHIDSGNRGNADGAVVLVGEKKVGTIPSDKNSTFTFKFEPTIAKEVKIESKAHWFPISEIEVSGIPAHTVIDTEEINLAFSVDEVKDNKVKKGDVVSTVPFSLYTQFPEFSISEGALSVMSNGDLVLTKDIDLNKPEFKAQTLTSVIDGKETNTTVSLSIMGGHGLHYRKWLETTYTHYNNFLKTGKMPDSVTLDINRTKNESPSVYTSVGDNFTVNMDFFYKSPYGTDKVQFAGTADDRITLFFNKKKILQTSKYSSYQNYDSTAASRAVFTPLYKNQLLKTRVVFWEWGGLASMSLAERKVAEGDNQNKWNQITRESTFYTLLTTESAKPYFEDFKHIASVDVDNVDGVVLEVKASDLTDENLTYTTDSKIFAINNKGEITVKGNPAKGNYTVKVSVTDGVTTITTEVMLDVKIDVKTVRETIGSLNEIASGTFDLETYANAGFKIVNNQFKKVYGGDLSKVESIYSDLNTKASFVSMSSKNISVAKNVLDMIESGEFTEEELKKYKNMILGEAVNVKANGMFKKGNFGRGYGESYESPYALTVETIKAFDAVMPRFLEDMSIDWAEVREAGLVVQDAYTAFYNYLFINKNLKRYEAEELVWRTAGYKLREANKSVKDLLTMSAEERESTLDIPFSTLNAMRVLLGHQRLDYNTDALSPKKLVDEYFAEKGIDDKNDYLTHLYEIQLKGEGLFKDTPFAYSYIERAAYFVYLGYTDKDGEDYNLMSGAEMIKHHLMLDALPERSFDAATLGWNDQLGKKWKMLQHDISERPWFLYAVEGRANKKECEWVVGKFFTEDSDLLEEKFAVGGYGTLGGDRSRYFTYGPYTSFDYIKTAKSWGKPFKGKTNRQDLGVFAQEYLNSGGVCGRISQYGQHVDNCMGIPTLGLNQPAHRAYLRIVDSGTHDGQGYKMEIRQGISGLQFSNFKYNPSFYYSKINAFKYERLTTFAHLFKAGNKGFDPVLTKVLAMQELARTHPEDAVNILNQARAIDDIVSLYADLNYQLAEVLIENKDWEEVKKLVYELLQRSKDYHGSTSGADVRWVQAREIFRAYLLASDEDKDFLLDQTKKLVKDSIDGVTNSIDTYRDVFKHKLVIDAIEVKHRQLIQDLKSKDVSAEGEDFEAYKTDVYDAMFKSEVLNIVDGATYHFNYIHTGRLFLNDAMKDDIDNAALRKFSQGVWTFKIYQDFRKTVLERSTKVDPIVISVKQGNWKSSYNTSYLIAEGKTAVTPLEDRGKTGSTTFSINVLDGTQKVAVNLIATKEYNGKKLAMGDSTDLGGKATFVFKVDAEASGLNSGIYKIEDGTKVKLYKQDTNTLVSLWDIPIKGSITIE